MRNKKILVVLSILIIICGIFIVNNIGYKTYSSKNFEVKYKKEWTYDESEDSVAFFFKDEETAFRINKTENKSNKNIESLSSEYRSALSLDTVKASGVEVTDVKLKSTFGKIDCKKFEFDLDGQGLEDAEGNKIEKTHIIQIIAIKGKYMYNASFRISQTINGIEKGFMDEKTYKKIENSIKFK